MAEIVIRTPVAGHTGPLGALHFVDGRVVADTELHMAEIAYCEARGYHFGEAEAIAAAEPVEAADAVATPKKSASAAEWRTYAVEHGGMAADEAAELSRDQLVERFITSKGDER